MGQGGTHFTIGEIVKEYLQENDFDGLFYPGECGCSIEDGLFACDGGDCRECQAGYKHDDSTGEYSFIISAEKSKAEGK